MTPPVGPFWPWYVLTTRTPNFPGFLAWITARWREWEALNGRRPMQFDGGDVPSFKKYLDAFVTQCDNTPR